MAGVTRAAPMPPANRVPAAMRGAQSRVRRIAAPGRGRRGHQRSRHLPDVALLRSGGIDHSLVDLGESRTLGSHPEGRAWEVAIADPDDAGRTTAVLPIVDRAVATSGAYGFRFDPPGRFNHLFDPASGRCAYRYHSVTTVARTAALADAYSTAFSLLSEEQIRSLMPRAGIERVHLIGAGGTVADFGG